MIIGDINKKISDAEKMILNASRMMDNAKISEIYISDFMRRYAWSTNHLEGNTLSLDETINSIDYDEVASGHTYSEYRDIKNLWNALQVFDFTNKVEITDEIIVKYNSLIRGETTDYRTKPVYIGNVIKAIYIPPDPEVIRSKMSELIKRFNEKNDSFLGLINSVAYTHIEFERLHPFMDGNGRTGRMIINRMLVNNDLFPISIESKSKYMQGFRAYDRTGDMSLTKKIILDAMIESTERINTVSHIINPDSCNFDCKYKSMDVAHLAEYTPANTGTMPAVKQKSGDDEMEM